MTNFTPYKLYTPYEPIIKKEKEREEMLYTPRTAEPEFKIIPAKREEKPQYTPYKPLKEAEQIKPLDFSNVETIPKTFEEIEFRLRNIREKIYGSLETTAQLFGVGKRPSTLIETLEKPREAFETYLRQAEQEKLEKRIAAGEEPPGIGSYFLPELGKETVVTILEIAKNLAEIPFKITKQFAYHPIFYKGEEPERRLPILGEITTYGEDYLRREKGFRDMGLDDRTANIAAILGVGGEAILDVAIIGRWLTSGAKALARKATPQLQEQMAAWKLLGEPKNSAALSKNLRQLSMQLHPDKLGGNEVAMREINNAYATLKNTGVPTAKQIITAKAARIGKMAISPISKIMDLPKPQFTLPLKRLPERAGYVPVEAYQPLRPVGAGLSIKPVPMKPVTTAEALKYKSAEEFVKAKATLMRGAKTAEIKAGEVGVYLTPDRKMAEVFAGKEGVITKAFADIKKTYKIPKADEYEWLDSLIENPRDYSKYITELKSKGYDSILSSDKKQLLVFDKNKVLTKSQLTDIWNKAIKGVEPTIAPEPQKGVVEAVKPTEAKPPIPPSPPPKEMPQFAGEPVGDPIAKLNELLKQAKPVRARIETKYTAERAKRIAEVERFINEQIDQVGGEEGYAKILARLKGELVSPEAKIRFEPIKEKLTEAELKDLYIRTWKHPYLDNWEKISAADGLTGLLAGEIPQPQQLVLLEEVYGTDLIKNILSKRLWGAKATDFILELMNLPRAILATADMSAFLRQGIVEVVAHPLISAKAGGKTFQFAFSPKAFKQWFDDLPKDKLYPLMRKSGLAITDPSKARMIGREEPFISRLLQKIPIIGQVIKFAERSYVGFLNKLRVDVFKTSADELLSKGFNPVKDIDLFKSAAEVVNTFTGRGSLGTLNRITPHLNALFFSPRLITARFNALNPVWYTRMPKEIRKKAIGDFAKFIVAGLTLLGIIKASGLVDVEDDPRSSDFGKIRIGNTRWDIWGGFQQWARVFAQITTGQRKNTTTGEIISLTKDEYPFTTRKEVMLRFIEGKLAPVPALVNELISGAKTFQGEDITFETVVKEKFIPMYIQDIAEAYADGGLGRAVGAGVAAFFGVGVQTWEKRQKIFVPKEMEEEFGEIKDIIPDIELDELLSGIPTLEELMR